MLSLRKLVLGFGALALLCTPAFAQGQGRGFGGGMMGGGPMMLGNPSVQKELKFTEEQTSKAQTALTEIREAHQEEMQGLRDAEPAERMTKMAALNKAMTNEAIKALGLKEEQVKRFHQISLQARRAQAFMDPEVASKLKITDDQKKQIQELTQDSGAKMREIFQANQDDRAEAMKQIQALQKETSTKVMALMTDDQKKMWKEMTGEPFEMVMAPRPN